ncbi:MAG TPA: response regulator [bacterium]|nr:response regulator [bacterium]
MALMGIQNRPFQVLLVEDDPGDARLTSEALKKTGYRNQVTLAVDGEKALDCLFQRGAYSNTPLPDLVLLDLNLPRVNGHDVLREIKDDARLKRIPVVILSSSNAEEDIQRAYNAHANCYVTKPIGLAPYFSAIQGIGDFWFKFAKLAGEN